ncbi:MAG: hypothetical protein ACLFP4_01600 [Spirochaetales bacterium]
MSDYVGLVCIGDPHLEGRQPGFRKDDYPTVILEKLEWILGYAAEHRLLPAFLGDVFDKPRDNPTWMIARLLDMLDGRACIGIYGNHDCADPVLSEHDSLMLLFKSGRIRRVTATAPWIGTMAGREVVIGGSSYREALPKRLEPRSETAGGALGVWLTHHDLLVPGYEEQGRIKPREIPGVALVVNGHIHRRLETVVRGSTEWVTPGNISRRSRNDLVREHIPSVLRVNVGENGITLERVTVPHQPFDEVFHAAVPDGSAAAPESAFVTGLAELQARRTASGAGLMSFLDANLGQFEEAVAIEIRALARGVTRSTDAGNEEKP